MKQKQTFASIMNGFGNYHDLKSVFHDFLQLAICACAQNPMTGKSYYEEEYLEIISKYEKGRETMLFKHLFSTLVNEMTDRLESETGYDVLGEYFEAHLVEKSNKNNQFFTPWPACQFMAQATLEESKQDRMLKILDPACGSGRMILAAAKVGGPNHQYFGIDVDGLCCRMSILNFFLSGLFHAEVMCANALNPNDFKFSHRTRLLPFGIQKITDKYQSRLWTNIQAIMVSNHQERQKKNEPAPWDTSPKSTFGDQLHLL